MTPLEPAAPDASAGPAEPPRVERDRFFDVAAELLSIAGRDGHIKTANAAWTRILGYSPEEVCAVPYMSLVHPDDVSAAREQLRRLARGRPTRDFEARLRHRDGSYRWFLWNVVSDTARGLLYAAGRDITERKRAEAFKRELISIAAHELRSPITAIHGVLDLVAETVAGLTPEQLNLVQVAAGSAERMGRLLDDLLEAERADAGGLRFDAKPLLLPALVEQSIQANQPYAARFGVRIELGRADPVSVVSDADRLHQVMTNLLTNAVKFSPAGDVVRVSVEHAVGLARVTVSDRGPGIPDAFRERVFQRFARGGTTDAERKGSGLGLALSKAIVEGLGGRIGFETRVQAGATFFFELPGV